MAIVYRGRLGFGSYVEYATNTGHAWWWRHERGSRTGNMAYGPWLPVADPLWLIRAVNLDDPPDKIERSGYVHSRHRIPVRLPAEPKA